FSGLSSRRRRDGNILANVESARQVFPSPPELRLLSILPLSHMFEQTVGLLPALAAGSDALLGVATPVPMLLSSYVGTVAKAAGVPGGQGPVVRGPARVGGAGRPARAVPPGAARGGAAAGAGGVALDRGVPRAAGRAPERRDAPTPDVVAAGGRDPASRLRRA